MSQAGVQYLLVQLNVVTDYYMVFYTYFPFKFTLI